MSDSTTDRGPGGSRREPATDKEDFELFSADEHAEELEAEDGLSSLLAKVGDDEEEQSGADGPVTGTQAPAAAEELSGASAEDPAPAPATSPGGNGHAPAGAVAAEVETEIVCPGCGLAVVGESSPRPTAAWFCPQCDYPLFWASPPPPDAEPTSRAARRRLPGTGGRVVLGAEPCWHCGEMAEPGSDECHRCAARLPKPLAPKVHVDVHVPVPVPVAVRPVVWPYVAAALGGGAAIAAAVTSWLSGG